MPAIGENDAAAPCRELIEQVGRYERGLPVDNDAVELVGTQQDGPGVAVTVNGDPSRLIAQFPGVLQKECLTQGWIPSRGGPPPKCQR